MNLMIPVWEDVLRMLIPMCTVICMAEAVLLLLFAEGSCSRRLLAYVMLAWGVVYTVCILGILLGFMGFMKTDILDSFVLISGNLYAIVLLGYPLEVVRPGWLNLKRCLLLISPYLLVVITYYTALNFLGESPVRLEDWSDFPVHIGRFHVWYKLVILLSIIAYIAYQLLIIYRHEVSYREWCDTNYASVERMEISWLRYHGLGVIPPASTMKTGGWSYTKLRTEERCPLRIARTPRVLPPIGGGPRRKNSDSDETAKFD